MSRFETDYKQLLSEVLCLGNTKANRTKFHTLSLFNQSLTINVQAGFPIVTGKQIFFDKARAEYEWIRDGLTHTTYLHQNGIKWWDEYADKNGYLGKTYGYQLRNFNGEVDQLDYVHRELRMNTRRAHVTYWNPSELNQVVLPPCFTGMTFMRIGDKLNMSVQFRSSDLFLGLPYDIVVFALMLHDVAEFNELIPYQLGIQITDAHIYTNHIEQVNRYYSLPTFRLPRLSRETTGGRRVLLDYKYGPYIRAKMNN